MREVPFLPAAEDEFLEAVAWYEADRAGLGAEFLAEVERATRRIVSFPEHGSPYLAGTRRIVLGRFPSAWSTGPTRTTCSWWRSRTHAANPATGGRA